MTRDEYTFRRKKNDKRRIPGEYPTKKSIAKTYFIFVISVFGFSFKFKIYMSIVFLHMIFWGLQT
ncbi:MAG: hypothetical protein DWQ10_13035 [Calditrichaeota bacterium]|nr:MAG: hypothetical protein DWQ10_13035 [Calditrichota bacterium]